MNYVDGFVLAVPKKKLAAYKRLAQLGCKVWLEHGALEYRECTGDDLTVKWGIQFPRLIKLKKNETLLFSWIVYKSRGERDRINAKVMKDPRMSSLGTEMPFDMKRMAFGGFKVLVSGARANRVR